MNWFKSLLTVAALGVLVIAPTAAQKNDAAQAMLAAKQKATLEGDLAGAIKQYQAVVDKYIKSDRGVAVQALLQMADCYQKQGSMQATKIYERVVREFSDQLAALAEARKHLVSAGAVSAHEALPRRVLKDGTAMVGGVSRDGRFAVGRESAIGGGINIVLHDLRSGRVTTLVARSASGSGNSPVMSNDGRRVAYSWNEPVVGGSGQRSIRIIGIESGSAPEVFLPPAPQPESLVQGGSRPLAWAPDGKEILASIFRNSDPASPELAWISVENKSVRTIRTLGPLYGTSLDCALSPDGRFIAFSARPRSDSADHYLYVMDANGQHETAIVKGAGERWDPVWTPDGSHLLFAGDSAGGPALWSIAIRDGRAAGEPSIVQTGFTDIWPVGMTTSGTLHYSRIVDGVDYALVAPRNPSPGDRALAFPGLRASWSRDDRLAFVRAAGQGPVNDLIIRDVKTGEERSYRRPGLINSVSPRWLHDGSGVIVVIDEQGSGASAVQAFYRVDTRSGTFLRLFAKDANNRIRSAESAISLDDKTLYLTVRQSPGTATTGVVGVDLTTATEKPVFTFAGAGLRGGASPSLEMSPDGTTLAVMALADGPGGARQARIFGVRVDGSNYREIYGLFPIFGGPRDKMRWTPDGRAIVFIVPDPADRNSARLMRVSAEGGQATFDGLDLATMSQLLTGLHMDRSVSMRDFDLSPDGSRAVVSARTISTYELWSIDNLLSAKR